MLINLSNHPSTNWIQKQTFEALKRYDSMTDISFPNIDPSFSEDDIALLTKKYFS
ncbi:MAG: hypothetical protein HGGPFJEG_01900 [Ignavibacteria bacterium]|nr:hypothetical protein [Ignavibacteria bacterium]